MFEINIIYVVSCFFLMKLDIKIDWLLKICGFCFIMFGFEGKNDKRIYFCFFLFLINLFLFIINYKKGFIFKDVVDFFGVKILKWILKGKYGIFWYFNLRRMRFMKYVFFMYVFG